MDHLATHGQIRHQRFVGSVDAGSYCFRGQGGVVGKPAAGSFACDVARINIVRSAR